MSERSLTLAIDCDDVLIPFAHRTVEHYNKTWGLDVDVAHYYDGPEHWGVASLDIASKRVEQYMREHAHKELVTPDFDAVVAIKSLARVHRQLLLTGRSDFMAPITNAMATTHFPDCFQKIIHTNHYGENARSKGSICRDENVTILVDDGLMHCESAVEEGDVEAALLFDKPWNQSKTLHPKIIRCADWHVIQEEIAKVARS